MYQASLRRIDDQRNGSVIDQFYFHHCSEDTLPDRDSLFADGLYEVFVESFRILRSSRGCEGGSFSLSAVAVKRELRYHEHLAFYLRKAQIHFALFIREYSEAGDLLRHPTDLFRTIAVSSRKQHQKAWAYLPNHLAVNRYARSGNPLNYCSQP